MSNLSDHLLHVVLALLWSEVSEHGRHLSQYFNLFASYANLGTQEKTQLLKLNVPSLFISVSLDDGPGPPIKYQYAELGKLYQVHSNHYIYLLTKYCLHRLRQFAGNVDFPDFLFCKL